MIPLQVGVPGGVELLVILLVAIVVFGVPIVLVGGGLYLYRRSRSDRPVGDEVEALRAEVERLREEVDRLAEDGDRSEAERGNRSEDEDGDRRRREDRNRSEDEDGDRRRREDRNRSEDE